jgi:hypothetical protein
MQHRARRPAIIPLALALFAVALLVAIPALAADPSPSPGTSQASEKPGKGPKQAKDKTPKAAVTLTGTVQTRSAADGEVEYTLTSGSTTYTLDAGPAWYWKDDHPLRASVGKRVTIAGEQAQGSTSVDVQAVDGTALREAGKPPWAGGWKRVGQDHPGWSQEKADRWAAKAAEKRARFGLDCWPPGQCKDPTGKPANPAATPTP